LQQSATLANAIAAVAGLFLLVESVFGLGILSGGFVQLPGGEQQTISMQTRWARLFAKV
jgi:hypothetical protein